MNSPQRIEYPDLLKTSDAYRAHEDVINASIQTAFGLRKTIEAVLVDATRAIKERRGQSSDRQRSLPSVASVEREGHINCMAAQILFHHVARQLCDVDQRWRDNDAHKHLYKLILQIASTRISIINFTETHESVDHTSHIQEIDKEFGRRKLPSVVPYLFSPNTVQRHLKDSLRDSKFDNPELLLDIADLYPEDAHLLHTVCISVAQAGMPGEILTFLKNRAEKLYPGQHEMVALTQLFQHHIDLASAYLLGAVESGQFDQALRVGKMLRARIHENENLAEKYAIALRAIGKFEDAIEFIEDMRNKGLNGKTLSTQLNLARAGYKGVFTPTLDALDAFRRERDGRK